MNAPTPPGSAREKEKCKKTGCPTTSPRAIRGVIRRRSSTARLRSVGTEPDSCVDHSSFLRTGGPTIVYQKRKRNALPLICSFFFSFFSFYFFLNAGEELELTGANGVISERQTPAAVFTTVTPLSQRA